MMDQLLPKQQLQILLDELQKQIDKYHEDRINNSHISQYLRLTTAILAAATSVLLGLTFAPSQAEIYIKTAALIIGASISVITTVQADNNFYAKYVNSTITYKKLLSLKFDIDYALAGALPQDYKVENINTFRDRFEHILSENESAWETIRQPNQTRQGTATQASGVA